MPYMSIEEIEIKIIETKLKIKREKRKMRNKGYDKKGLVYLYELGEELDNLEEILDEKLEEMEE